MRTVRRDDHAINGPETLAKRKHPGPLPRLGAIGQHDLGATPGARLVPLGEKEWPSPLREPMADVSTDGCHAAVPFLSQNVSLRRRD
jgi:hypothetical protein